MISELYSKHKKNGMVCQVPAHEALYTANMQFVLWKFIWNVLMLVFTDHKEALKRNAKPESELCDWQKQQGLRGQSHEIC